MGRYEKNRRRNIVDNCSVEQYSNKEEEILLTMLKSSCHDIY